MDQIKARHFAARERVRMNAILVDNLEQKSRDLNKRIQIKLARLKFISIFRRADDQTKEEMMRIILIDGRNRQRGTTKMKAFLSNIFPHDFAF